MVVPSNEDIILFFTKEVDVTGQKTLSSLPLPPRLPPESFLGTRQKVGISSLRPLAKRAQFGGTSENRSQKPFYNLLKQFCEFWFVLFSGIFFVRFLQEDN